MDGPKSARSPRAARPPLAPGSRKAIYFRNSLSLATLLLKDVLPGAPLPPVNGIHLQEYAAEKGITDIEVEAGDVRVIVEAKRGWTLPSLDQLRQYAARKPRLVVVLSECSAEYAKPRLASQVAGVPVTHRSWRDVAKLTRAARRIGDRAQGRVLDEFLTYLETAMPVQDQESNLVYVVSLSLDTPKGWGISNIDIVEKRGRYFHPVGDRWPKEPPNYLVRLCVIIPRPFSARGAPWRANERGEHPRCGRAVG
jgi:hypothetical protein